MFVDPLVKKLEMNMSKSIVRSDIRVSNPYCQLAHTYVQPGHMYVQPGHMYVQPDYAFRHIRL